VVQLRDFDLFPYQGTVPGLSRSDVTPGMRPGRLLEAQQFLSADRFSGPGCIRNHRYPTDLAHFFYFLQTRKMLQEKMDSELI
jgi:hypothetical protein